MANIHLKHMLMKLKRTDTAELLGKWGKCTVDLDNISQSMKLSTVKHVVENCENVTREDVWQLDLLNLQKHPTSKLWTAYNYQQIPGTEPPADLASFKKLLKKEMNLYFRSDVSLAESDGVYWVRVWFHEGHTRSLPRTRDVTYVAYVPGTDFFFLTPIKRTYTTAIIQAMMMTLDGHQPQKKQLYSRHLYSLIQMKNNEGGLNSRGLKIAAIAPEERILEEHVLEEDVEDEEEEKYEYRLQTTERIFGPHLQPKLDKLEFTLGTPFKPCPGVPVPLDTFAADEGFSCAVTFSGANVLEGIRKLAEHTGLTDLPLPTHLCQLPAQGFTKITLKPKRKRMDAGDSQVSQG